MFTVMKDPVMLPSSKTIIDRATIKSHLLSDSKDPFNRAPLTIDEVIERMFDLFTPLRNSSRLTNGLLLEPELKLKITTYLQERRHKAAAPVDENAMNVDT